MNSFTHKDGLDPNISFLVCLVLFLASRPKKRELFAMAAFAAFIAVWFGFRGSLLEAALQLLSYAGAGALGAAFLLPYLSGRWDWRLVGKLLFPPSFGILTTFLLSLCVSVVTYDYLLYAFDGSLGFQPSFWAGRAVLSIPGMSAFTRLMYDSLSIFLALAYILEERRGQRPARDMILFLVLLGLCGAGCFILFPAVGTVNIFRSFPFHPPDLSSIPLIPTAVMVQVPRNCMPSLHTSWALAILWTSRKFSTIWRLLFGIALSFMLLQTLVYHYLADMIVAIPFTLAVYALTRTTLPWSSRQRYGAFGFGALLTAAWLIALRYGTGVFLISPVIPWSAAVGTLASCLRWRMHLNRAVDRLLEPQTPALRPAAADHTPARAPRSEVGFAVAE